MCEDNPTQSIYSSGQQLKPLDSDLYDHTVCVDNNTFDQSQAALYAHYARWVGPRKLSRAPLRLVSKRVDNLDDRMKRNYPKLHESEWKAFNAWLTIVV